MSSFRIETNKRSLGFPEVIPYKNDLQLTIEKGLGIEDFIGWVFHCSVSSMGVTAEYMATVAHVIYVSLFAGGPTVSCVLNVKDPSDGVGDVGFIYNPANGRVIFTEDMSKAAEWLFPEEEG